jgi:hypothetical protein
MKLPEKVPAVFRVPKLTWKRIAAALAVAVCADGLQLLLGPAGWVFGDQVIDVLVMALASWLIGFHWLLLPTFVLETVPALDDFPTWTACIIAVVALRKREQRRTTPSGPGN